ncbi:hypothetical protein [Novosphingobium terrae]|uniref:hypothetical protein n=1 Tax=Novosphingobium terrae TaxID=2726189 RepID=UPI00197F7048|nr:hypothetical protein [Novosphingobium terrae]
MFDQIDAAYYRMRAKEEREKALESDAADSSKHRARAEFFEQKASALVAPAVA